MKKFFHQHYLKLFYVIYVYLCHQYYLKLFYMIYVYFIMLSILVLIHSECNKVFKGGVISYSMSSWFLQSDVIIDCIVKDITALGDIEKNSWSKTLRTRRPLKSGNKSNSPPDRTQAHKNDHREQTMGWQLFTLVWEHSRSKSLSATEKPHSWN